MSNQTSSAARDDNDGPRAGVRVYRGRNLIDLIPRIRADLGPDAVILREREGVVGGINGFFAKRFVEVEAQAAPRVDLYDDDDDDDGDDDDQPEGDQSQDDWSEGDRYDQSEDDQTFADELAGAEVETETIIAAEERRLAAAKSPAQATATAQIETPIEAQALMESTTAAEAHAAALRRAAGELQAVVDAQLASLSSPRPPQEPRAAIEPQAVIEPEAAVRPQPVVEEARVSDTPTPGVPGAPRAPGGESRGPFKPPPAYEPQPEVEARCAVEPEFEIKPAPAIEDPLARNVPVRLEPLPPPRIKKKSMRSGRATSIIRQRALGDGDVGRAAWVTVAEALSERGMTDDEAKRLAMEAAAHGIPLARASALRDAVREMLARQLTRAPTLPATGAAVAFVGAGGTGKTRCAAALASAYRRASTLSVMALSLGDADDRRAIDTLLQSEGVPVKSGADVRSVARLVNDVRAGGVVVVDTPAIAPGERSAVLTLAERLEPLRLDGVFVTVPATIGTQAARQLLSALEPLHPAGIAVTHLDETDQLGVAVQLAAATGTPIAYVHEGLDLRRALSAPDPIQLATRLLP